MGRQLISSGSPFEKSIGFSRAVRAGNIISVSGTAPIDDDGQTVGIGNLYIQTKRCFEIMIDALVAAGGKADHVSRTRIYLRDATHWKEAARVHHEFFQEIRPACTFVEVKGFINPEWLVETELDCVVTN